MYICLSTILIIFIASNNNNLNYTHKGSSIGDFCRNMVIEFQVLKKFNLNQDTQFYSTLPKLIHNLKQH